MDNVAIELMRRTRIVEFRKHKRMHQKSILFMAGVLGHWVTDMSNPIHASIHVHGWHRSVPNPRGYVSPDDDPRSRCESKYLNLRDIWYTAWVRSGQPMPKKAKKASKE